jgi:hypothetical protein
VLYLYRGNIAIRQNKLKLKQLKKIKFKAITGWHLNRVQFRVNSRKIPGGGIPLQYSGLKNEFFKSNFEY